MHLILPNINYCSNQQIKSCIARYGAFVELLSFWSVMGYAYFWVKSTAGKDALIDNLDCEGKQNHQMMLDTFLRKCDAIYDQDTSCYIRDALKPARVIMQKYANKESAFAHIAFLTLAENTSLEFIPWLAQGAKRLGCDDFTYTDVHGEADIKHAQLFEKAFYEEREFLAITGDETQEIVDIYFTIMGKVFHK